MHSATPRGTSSASGSLWRVMAQGQMKGKKMTHLREMRTMMHRTTKNPMSSILKPCNTKGRWVSLLLLMIAECKKMRWVQAWDPATHLKLPQSKTYLLNWAMGESILTVLATKNTTKTLMASCSSSTRSFESMACLV